ncbi:MAG: TIGR03936 family radical SAM-associated protein [Treponema sp.]|nr:TIGR03936 family radical SAM-associated protein [Treponema sp.]
MIRYVDPVKEFGGQLLNVDKPSRYVGGEVGRLARKEEEFRTLIAFPDLYEIGMGNQALRIIYNHINNLNGISCDRTFAPAPDFEKMLRENNVPLYGLDTGISLANLDILMFTLGYELGLNGILTIMDVSGIPIHCKNRDNNYPIVIAGGPAISNPLPYSSYIETFWIGEAEAGFFDLVNELAVLKREGQGRAVLLKKLESHPNIWVKGKEKVKRAIASGFSSEASVYPVPNMKIIQHHGTVEIMRGCPNGCRFCHAGFWYRPARQKNKEIIYSNVNEMITKGGWQEISLSSLSSGDYDGIGELIENLNDKFKDLHVSFQLPSLKVSSFALSILKKISVTRKSGLTFAVETPNEMRQMSINKDVNRDSVVEIINEARKSGWRVAKFYFMIGLPGTLNDEEEIVSFITDVSQRTKMRFNINVGLFIPKPHTPYQSVSQLNNETAGKKFDFIRSKLKPMGHKVSVSDLLISSIEGLLSRGDERSGLLYEETWKNGSRLDAWDEFINREKWLTILENNSSYINSVFSGKLDPVPWFNIDSCVSKEYLKQEMEKSNSSERTASCKEKCSFCGISCGKKLHKAVNIPETNKTGNLINQNITKVNKINTVNHVKKLDNETSVKKTDPAIYRVLFSFNKEGRAVFHGHLSLIEVFSFSFRRAGIQVKYTQGFNPLAKIEFASTLSTGVSANNEIASVDFSYEIDTEIFLKTMNECLPEGIKINRAEIFLIKSGMKKHSLSSLLWGFSYAGNETLDYIKALDEKTYRLNRSNNDRSFLFNLTRTEVLARNITDYKEKEWASYFDVYNFLYNTDNS